MIAVSFWCAQPPINHDTGLYHYPSMRWVNDNPLPLGLANLHHRFGFNSLWFPLAAVLRLPFFPETGVHCFSVSALLVFFFGISIATAFASLRAKYQSADNIFLLLSALILLGKVFRRNVSSPSPDFAILLLCVFVFYLALQTIEMASDWLYKCFQIIVLSVFAVAIKLSALPLLLVPLSLLLLGFRRKVLTSPKQFAGYCFLFSSIITSIWLARGIILSGCLVSAIHQSCFQSLSWTIPAHFDTLFNSEIKLTARYPNQVPPKIDTGWNWLGPWIDAQLLSIDFVLSLTLLAAGLMLLLLTRPVRKELVWLVLPLVLAVLFWFFTAPDMRFGAGYFWTGALLILSEAMQRKHTENGTLKKILVIFLFSATFVLVNPLRIYLYFGLPPVRKAFRNMQEFLFVLPIPNSKTKLQFTSDGIPVRIPLEGSDCWFADVPCTPYFDTGLKIEKSETGDYSKFYFP